MIGPLRIGKIRFSIARLMLLMLYSCLVGWGLHFMGYPQWDILIAGLSADVELVDKLMGEFSLNKSSRPAFATILTLITISIWYALLVIVGWLIMWWVMSYLWELTALKEK